MKKMMLSLSLLLVACATAPRPPPLRAEYPRMKLKAVAPVAVKTPKFSAASTGSIPAIPRDGAGAVVPMVLTGPSLSSALLAQQNPGTIADVYLTLPDGGTQRALLWSNGQGGLVAQDGTDLGALSAPPAGN